MRRSFYKYNEENPIIHPTNLSNPAACMQRTQQAAAEAIRATVLYEDRVMVSATPASQLLLTRKE